MDLRSWMREPSRGRIIIMSSDWKTWEQPGEIEDDLLTFENSTMDHFTALITYTLVDMYHYAIGRFIHVRFYSQMCYCI
jgi:hypothetical protein